MKRLSLVWGLLGLAAMSAADAQPIRDICYGPPVSVAACFTSVCEQTTSATVFACPLAGSHTLPELAAAGWSVISLESSLAQSINPGTGETLATAQLVIAKRDRLFANGFDVGAGR